MAATYVTRFDGETRFCARDFWWPLDLGTARRVADGRKAHS